MKNASNASVVNFIVPYAVILTFAVPAAAEVTIESRRYREVTELYPAAVIAESVPAAEIQNADFVPAEDINCVKI